MRQTAIILLALCASARLASAGEQTNVAIVIYEGTEILDFGGPAEVLQAAGNFAGDGITSALNVYTVAKTRDPIVSQGFIRIVPQYSIADAPRPDIIVIPGGQSSQISDSDAMMKWLRSSMASAEVTLTVCTGAFPVAETGVLDGMEITTYYQAVEDLQKKAPKTRVKPGRRFIDNGKYITTAGVSAGIDGALHLVARRFGRRVADQTARYMEYRWTPEPFLSLQYKYWNPSTDERGRMLQQAEMASDEKRYDEAVAVLRRLVAKRPRDEMAWLHLGYALSTRKDRSAAIAAYQRVPASSKLHGEALYYIAREHAALGDKKKAAQQLSRAVAAGFDRDRALSDPLLASLRDAVPAPARPKSSSAR